MAKLYQELRRRNVFKVAAAYLVVCWVIVEVSSTVFPVLQFPDWTVAFVTVLLILGFPIACLFAWAFELTPDGLARSEQVDPDQSITHLTGRKLDFVIIGFLAIGLAYFFWESRVADESPSDATVEAPRPGQQKQTARWAGATEPPSIAVLPFVNLSDDKSQEFFADGLSEELLNLLAQTRGLKVTARSSSFAFKGQNKSISEIAEILKVKTVLEGSVRRSGNRLRINAQLINAADGYHLWSQSYDREMANVFELQDDIAGKIIAALRGQLDTGAVPTPRRPTDNMAAYNLYLQGQDRIRADDYVAAITLFRQAIELAPDFAEAHEQLAISVWSLAGGIIDMPEAMDEAHRAAARALELNPDLSHARALFIASDMADYDRLLELQSFERLVQEQPQNSKARAGLVYTLLILGYFREALAAAQEAVAQDPLYGTGHVRLGEALYATGDRETARKEWETAASLNAFIGRWYAAVAALLAGEDDLAVEYMSRVEWNSEAYIDRFRALIAIARSPGGGDKLLNELRAGHDDYYEYGFLFVPLGMIDEAYEYYESLGAFQPPQTNAELAIEDATILTGSGFTAHPRYVEMATIYGLASVWDRRGPPDHCDKINGNWTCR